MIGSNSSLVVFFILTDFAYEEKEFEYLFFFLFY